MARKVYWGEAAPRALLPQPQAGVGGALRGACGVLLCSSLQPPVRIGVMLHEANSLRHDTFLV